MFYLENKKIYTSNISSHNLKKTSGSPVYYTNFAKTAYLSMNRLKNYLFHFFVFAVWRQDFSV